LACRVEMSRKACIAMSGGNDRFYRAWFGQVEVNATEPGFETVDHTAVSGNDHDNRLSKYWPGRKGTSHFIAIHLRELDIQKDQRGRNLPFSISMQSFDTVRESSDGVALTTKTDFDDLANRCRVVYHGNLARTRSPREMPSLFCQD